MFSKQKEINKTYPTDALSFDETLRLPSLVDIGLDIKLEINDTLFQPDNSFLNIRRFQVGQKTMIQTNDDPNKSNEKIRPKKDMSKERDYKIVENDARNSNSKDLTVWNINTYNSILP